MSGKVEKSEKSAKLPRERSKGSKDKDSGSDQALESSKGENDSGRSVSPKNTKKRKVDSVLIGASPVAGVRFEGMDDKGIGREKISSRSSSAGPAGVSDVRGRGDTMDEAEILSQLFKDFVGQMSGPLNSVVRKNHELKSQVSMLLKASQSEEAPYVAMAREKDHLAREYDQLRYEHHQLQQEFQQIRRENLDLVATVQHLQQELAALKPQPTTPRSHTPTELGSAVSNPATPVAALSHLRRKDNVAELEQSILDLEEEIRSPRKESSLIASSSSTSSAPHSQTSSSSDVTPSSSVNGGAKDRDTPNKKRKVPKSHSNDPMASSIVHSPSGLSANGSATRAKSPPERVVSAPTEVKSAINAAHHIAASSGHSKSGNASSSGQSASKGGSSTPEDREEARLAKYTTSGGLGRRSSPNLGSKTNIAGTRNSSSISLTFAEQATFAQLFRKWDSNDDDFIDRHYLQVTCDAMASHETLKELHSVVGPHFSKIDWSALGIGTSAQLSLASALSYLSDCKAGSPNPSVFQSK